MKPYLAPFALVCCTASLQAAILTVDNNPGSVAMHRSFASAHDAASDGDTILINGSEIDYGPSTVTKRLRIVGPGYNLKLDRNNVPGISRWTAVISLSFRTTQTSSASGSQVEGMDLTVSGGDGWGVLQNGGTTPATNITIDGCYLRGTGTLTSRYTVRRSLVRGFGMGAGSGPGANPSATAGTLLTNCVFTLGQVSVSRDVSNVAVDRCTFIDSLLHINSPNAVTNSIHYNSGLYAAVSFDESSSPANFSYSVFVNHRGDVANSFDPNGPGVTKLQGEASKALIFTGTPEAIQFNNGFPLKDNLFTLKSGSPAIGAASDGGDIGAFSGPNPYKLSGVPAVPKLTHLVVPTSATSTSGLRFEVEAQAFGE